MVDIDDYISMEDADVPLTSDDEATSSKPVEPPVRKSKYKLKFEDDIESDEDDHEEPNKANGSAASRSRSRSKSKTKSPVEKRRKYSSSVSRSPSRSKSPVEKRRKRSTSRSKSPVEKRRNRSRSISHSRSKSRSPADKRPKRYKSRSRSLTRSPVERRTKSTHFIPVQSARGERDEHDDRKHWSRDRDYSRRGRSDRDYKVDPLEKKRQEDAYWEERRSRRTKVAERGVRDHHKPVWGFTPTHSELEEVYAEHEESERRALEARKELDRLERKRLKEKQKELKKLNRDGSADDDSDRSDSEETSSETPSGDSSSKKRKKHKKHKKHSKKAKKLKKEKKREKKKKTKKSKKYETASEEDEESESDSEIEEVWVEKTKEVAEEEAKKAKEEDKDMVGPALPAHLMPKTTDSHIETKIDPRDLADMPRHEASAFAAYITQGKRIPRRGEIGLTSGEIEYFEKAGYVMSGTRHKTMEATRLKKESQILTAEEKRLLSGFTQEQRKRKEELTLAQFKELIASKKSKQ